ncbi:OmpA family protein [Microbacterium sp. NPDC055683]
MSRRTTLALLVSLGSAGLLLAGCTADVVEQTASPSPSADAATTRVEETASPAAATPSASPTAPAARSGLPTVAGYAVGDFPAVPLFTLPDLSLLDASTSSFAIETRDALADVPGAVVSAARCDAAGEVVSGDGTAYLYGDGSGSYTGPDGGIRNYGDGSGSFTLNGVVVENYGDGSGSYDDGTVSIQNYGDGSGSYEDADIAIQIYGDGSGSYEDGAVSIQNYGDGSGSYEDGAVEIQNYGDGSGSYRDADIEIRNHGDGTGTVDGEWIDVEPLAPVPVLGVFPPLTALAPVESCGTTISFEDGVLFDFAESAIRPDAAEVLTTVAQVLSDADVSSATVSGHTDAIGSDEENLALSQARADAVVAALRADGVTADLRAEGYGESRPVAANEIDGVDNPAGRQLNRRVEIFLPAV